MTNKDWVEECAEEITGIGLDCRPEDDDQPYCEAIADIIRRHAPATPAIDIAAIREKVEEIHLAVEKESDLREFSILANEILSLLPKGESNEV